MKSTISTLSGVHETGNCYGGFTDFGNRLYLTQMETVYEKK